MTTVLPLPTWRSLARLATGTLAGLLVAGCSSSDDDAAAGDSSAASGAAPAPSPIAIDTASKLGDDTYPAASVFAVPQTVRGSASLYVRLAADPGGPVTVAVDHSGGDPDQTIYDLGTHSTATSVSLAFDSGNYDQWQQVYLVTDADSDGATAAATYELTGSGLATTTITSLPAPTADSTVAGTIERDAFVLAKSAVEAHDDIAFALSWIKVGTGSEARYYGSYSDDDPLNALPDDARSTGAQGNPDRDTFHYPAYGFWHGGELCFIVAKPVLTPRTTVEANLLLLTATDETFASGTGLLTATDGSRQTGTYPISFSATAQTAAAMPALLPLAETPDYPIDGQPLQLSAYGGAGGISTTGQWQLDLGDWLYTGESFDTTPTRDGEVHGLVTGSATGLGVPNLLGVREASGGDLHIYGLPFYSEPSSSFPFGSLGGRWVDVADGTSDRTFLFLSFTSN